MSEPEPRPDDPAQSAAPPGRRERKKEATRQTIVKVAFTLFATKGYEGTTVADIASAADVAERTVYFHFRAGKVDLLFHPIAERVSTLIELLGGRDDREATLDVLEAFLRQAPDPTYHLASELAWARRAVIGNVTLTGAVSERWRVAIQGALRESFARELGTTADSLEARAMATIANAVGSDYARLLVDEDRTPDDADAYLRRAFPALRAAQTALLGGA